MNAKAKKLSTAAFLAIAGVALAAVLRSGEPAAPPARTLLFHTESAPAEPLVEIVPAGKVDRTELEAVAEAISNAFHVRTRVAGGFPLPEPARDEARGQYNADWILRVAQALGSGSAWRTLLVTQADTYSGELPYVLSGASGDRKTLLICTFRLGSAGHVEFPVELARNRLRRLAVCVLASSLGLRRCDNDCILAAGTDPAGLDGAPDYFCPECARTLQDILRTGIGSPHSHLHTALLYLEDGSLDGAISELKKAVALKPDYLAAYLNLGEVYAAKGWYAEAVTAYRRAAQAAPEIAEPRTRLAQVLLLSNQPAAALEALQAALALDRGNREVHRLLGIAYHFYLGRPERACAHYRRFLELGGDPEEIKDLLEHIEGRSRGKARQ